MVCGSATHPLCFCILLCVLLSRAKGSTIKATGKCSSSAFKFQVHAAKACPSNDQSNTADQPEQTEASLKGLKELRAKKDLRGNQTEDVHSEGRDGGNEENTAKPRQEPTILQSTTEQAQPDIRNPARSILLFFHMHLCSS
jgi:hypothetical protein